MQFGLAQLVPVNWAKFFIKMGIQEITNYEKGGWEEKKRIQNTITNYD